MNSLRLSGTLKDDPKIKTLGQGIAATAILLRCDDTDGLRIVAAGEVAKAMAEFHQGDSVAIEGLENGDGEIFCTHIARYRRFRVAPRPTHAQLFSVRKHKRHW